MVNRAIKPKMIEKLKAVGNPYQLMIEIYELIKKVTQSMKEVLNGVLDSYAGDSYLLTSDSFEKAFSTGLPTGE